VYGNTLGLAVLNVSRTNDGTHVVL
jgi:hypothetical protein